MWGHGEGQYFTAMHGVICRAAEPKQQKPPYSVERLVVASWEGVMGAPHLELLEVQ